MPVISQSGRGSASIGAAPPPEPGPNPPGPTFQEAHRDSTDSATDDTSWLAPVAPDPSVAGAAEKLCVISSEDAAVLDAMSDQDVVDNAEVEVPLEGVDMTQTIIAKIPNDLPAGAVLENYRAVIVYKDSAPTAP